MCINYIIYNLLSFKLKGKNCICKYNIYHMYIHNNIYHMYIHNNIYMFIDATPENACI